MALTIKKGVAANLEVGSGDLAADAVITAKISAAQVTAAKSNVKVFLCTANSAGAIASAAHGLGAVPTFTTYAPNTSNVVYGYSAANATYVYFSSESAAATASCVVW